MNHFPTPSHNSDDHTITTESNRKPHKTQSSAIQIVWQWLCYVLWGGALAAMSVLISSDLNYFIIDKTKDYEFVIYTLAVMLALLPMALLADRIYRRQEPAEKHGFASVVMVLNAVIIFLITLGSLITAIVTALSMLVNPGGADTKLIIILSSLVALTLGTMLFLRIINSPRLHRFSKLFPRITIGIAALVLIGTAIGPLANQVAARNDKLIEEHLPTINNSIQDYASKNDKLPASLEDLSLDDPYQKDAKVLITNKLVEYREIDNDSEEAALDDKTTKSMYLPPEYADTPYKTYELCVTYQRERNRSGRYYYDSSDYSYSYIDTHSHEAGRKCYKQRAYLDDPYDVKPL